MASDKLISGMVTSVLVIDLFNDYCFLSLRGFPFLIIILLKVCQTSAGVLGQSDWVRLAILVQR